jgi:NADPH:quinone reductase-like Zn-dependent oxidoreductase
VDNNSHFARSARLFLDQSGKYVACSVIDPPRALETARSFKPDLVIVDLIKSPELSKQIQIATGGMPISLGLDAVGGPAAETMASVLSPGAHLVSYAGLDSEQFTRGRAVGRENIATEALYELKIDTNGDAVADIA